MANYDLIIKNGMVFDGKGNPPVRADIGVSGGIIKKIGDLSDDKSGEILDAEGKYVTPGFIDITNHSDTHWTLFSNPTQESLLRQGITTIIGGSCGTSLAPYAGKASEQEIGRWTDVSNINIDWNSVGEFLDKLEQKKIGVNFGTFVGLNTLQRIVIKDGGELISEEERNEIKLLFKRALEDGVFGISTNLGLTAVKSKDDAELADIFMLAGKYNAVVKHHLEDEGENLLPAVSRVVSLAGKTGARTHISHLKAVGKKSWPLLSSALKMMEDARGNGIKITCDFTPYLKTGSNLTMLLPFWFRKMPVDERKKILVDKTNAKRAEIVDYLKQITLHYENIIVASAGGNIGYIGKTLAQLMADLGLSGEEMILNLLEMNDFRVSIFNEVLSFDNILDVARRNFSVVASDGVGYSLIDNKSHDLPHPRSFGAFSAVLSILAKETTILSWEAVIYKMTGLPAEIIGLKDRGTIAAGNKADILVFDQNKIAGLATYENPFKYAAGMEHVIVNGSIEILYADFVGNLAGAVLRKK